MIDELRSFWLSLLVSCTALLCSQGAASAEMSVSERQNRTEVPFAPFKVAGNLYFVGGKEHAHFLVTTSQGHILINTGYPTPASVAQIRQSVEKLGFKYGDIKTILIGHAHVDHDGGSAQVKAETGAKYMVMEQDVDVVESGGKADFYYNDPGNAYPPTKVDRVLHDGDEVKLGDAVLVAHLTPGHTKGCTTYTMKVQDAGKTYNVVIVGSLSVNPTYHLLDKPSYPGIVEDFERAFRVMKYLPADIWVAPHGDVFDMEAKYAKLQQQGAGNPFIDPAGYIRFVARAERVFRDQLAKEQAALQKQSGQ